MTERHIVCEGPDDLNALRAVAQLLDWARPVRMARLPGAGQERAMQLQADDVSIHVSVPSKSRGATGEGKSALARSLATDLLALRRGLRPDDEAHVSLVAVVFDPDERPAAGFHDEVERAVAEHAPQWTLATTAPGTWAARHEDGEMVNVRAVHWRSIGQRLDGLPDHDNLERLLCAVLARAYPAQNETVERWLDELGAERPDAGGKRPTWKAAIHLWLAVTSPKVDGPNAPTRFLHQQPECRRHAQEVLEEAGLVADLRPLLAP